MSRDVGILFNTKEQIDNLSDLDAARVRRRKARNRLSYLRLTNSRDVDAIKYAEIDCNYAQRDVVVAKILIAMGSKLKLALDENYALINPGLSINKTDSDASYDTAFYKDEPDKTIIVHPRPDKTIIASPKPDKTAIANSKPDKTIIVSPKPVDTCESGQPTDPLNRPPGEEKREKAKESTPSSSDEMTEEQEENARLNETIIALTEEVRRWKARTVTIDQTMHRYKA
eukprot:Ihof_evm2s426 gene=Ihof_evmTU2s426